MIETLRRVLLTEADAIRDLADRLDESFVQAVEWIEKCSGRIITCGVGKSGHIAKKTSGTLSSTGTPSFFVHAAEAVHGDLGMITDQDIVLMLTYSGETDELVRLFPSIKDIGARTILITGRPNSSAGREADLVLNAYVEREACPNNLAPTTSTTVMIALCDALAVAVMERRGFTSEDFARFHPSGSLGKRLTLRVSDVMRQGDDLPVVKRDMPLIEVLRVVTQTGAGAAVVADSSGALEGFITEGDVRRYLVEPNPDLQTPAESLMNENPATIEPGLLAFEALEVFQNHPVKMGEMPVVSDGKVVGLLMIKDLLRSGIV